MGPMRRVMVGFEAPQAPVEAAWALVSQSAVHAYEKSVSQRCAA